jgi:Mn-containing catalase
LHNFFLESGARMGKIRVYESTQNPVAREMVGYLIVRGGVHQEAYAKALSDLSGVDVTKRLPVPEIDNTKFPHARKFMDRSFHRILYRFSPDDYRQVGEFWNGQQADTGEPRDVLDGLPEGGEVPDLTPAAVRHRGGLSREGVRNLARFSFLTVASRNPPMLYIRVGPREERPPDTKDNPHKHLVRSLLGPLDLSTRRFRVLRTAV